MKGEKVDQGLQSHNSVMAGVLISICHMKPHFSDRHGTAIDRTPVNNTVYRTVKKSYKGPMIWAKIPLILFEWICVGTTLGIQIIGFVFILRALRITFRSQEDANARGETMKRSE